MAWQGGVQSVGGSYQMATTGALFRSQLTAWNASLRIPENIRILNETPKKARSI